MRISATITALITAATLAACGGGGSGGGGSLPVPITSPVPQQSGNIPLQDAIAGTPVFVDPTTHFTLYFLDSDTGNGNGCTGSCTQEWPVMTAASGSQGQGNMHVITRADGSMQWAYGGHPLYHFNGDTGPDQGHGVYGPWHMAGANPTATLAPGAPPCKNYC